jgi:hypothetical protein
LAVKFNKKKEKVNLYNVICDTTLNDFSFSINFFDNILHIIEVTLTLYIITITLKFTIKFTNKKIFLYLWKLL